MKLSLFFLVLTCTGSSFAQSRNEVVIDEIMADPTPPVRAPGSLPDAEFIELKNVSSRVFNLNGWTIGDATGTATIRSNFLLQPDSFVVLCSTASQPRFAVYGAALGLANFPSLDNDGDGLFLRAANGKTIHSVQYNSTWYANAVKKDGGWSLEMVDPQNPCGDNNWLASTAPAGGTPGTKNSTNALNKDLNPPSVLNAFSPDPLHVVLYFSEPLDSSSALAPANYTLDGQTGAVIAAAPADPFFDQVLLVLTHRLDQNKIYQLAVKKLSDCSGNEISTAVAVRVSLAAPAEPRDIVINEILFNPPDDGADYVELYNRSNKTFNLKSLLLTSRSSTGSQPAAKPVSNKDRLLFPGDYIVVTENPLFIRNRFNPKNPSAITAMESMPSFPDDLGVAILFNNTGKIIDELAYDEDWHFKLVDNREGVALERIDFDAPTQDAMNWHTAATNSGYGTPTAQNSQYRRAGIADVTVELIPELFSPDNDGRDDFATIHYTLPVPGYICNIVILNAQGIPVKQLARNALCGLRGSFRWDGLDDKQAAMGIGVYVCITTIFNLQGKTSRFKHAIVLARNLH